MTRFIKNIIVIPIVIITTGSVFAQVDFIYYSGGYNLSETNLDGLNYFINSYNDQRTHLTRNLNEINLTHGFTVSGGIIIAKNLVIDIGFTQRRGYSYSDETLQGDQPYKRELLARINTIGIGIGKYIFWKDGYKLLVGSNIDFGKVVLRTRLYNTNDQTVPGYADVGAEFGPDFENNNNLIAVTPYAQFSYTPWGKQFEIVIKPYYQFQTKESYFEYVNQAWNPHTYQNDSPEATKNFVNSFGIQLKLNVLMGIDLEYPSVNHNIIIL